MDLILFILIIMLYSKKKRNEMKLKQTNRCCFQVFDCSTIDLR